MEKKGERVGAFLEGKEAVVSLALFLGLKRPFKPTKTSAKRARRNPHRLAYRTAD